MEISLRRSGEVAEAKHWQRSGKANAQQHLRRQHGAPDEAAIITRCGASHSRPPCLGDMSGKMKVMFLACKW